MMKVRVPGLQSLFQWSASCVSFQWKFALVHRANSTLQRSFHDIMAARKITIVGSGNWGSAIARIVGQNAATHKDQFDPEVRMWVFEEMIEGKKLTEIINTQHENVKYLPGKKLPENVVAVPDIVTACQEADILIFVIPHQFLERSLTPLKGKLKPSAQGISLIKGFHIVPSGGIELISVVIKELLNIPVSVLMGANLAGEVAADKFCETTIGAVDAAKDGKWLQTMFQTPNFRVVVVDDAKTVEICGALKNIVACGAGFVDGLNYGDNTKAAVIRLGLMEMIRYAEVFYPGSKLSTFFESCGVADLITTCYGGRNRRVSEAFVTSNKSIEELEKEMLNGQRLQGPETAAEVNFVLKAKGMEDQFPLFTSVHKICIGDQKPADFINQLRQHPEHMIQFDARL